MNVVETLKLTKTLLQEKGRTYGRFQDLDGHLCLLGAVAVATLGQSEFDRQNEDPNENIYNIFRGPALPVVEAIALEIEQDDEDWHQPEYHEVAYRFNDEAGRTDDEVFDLLDRAIEAAS